MYTIIIAAGAILMLLYAALILLYRFGWKKLPSYEAKYSSDATHTFSIIVPFRNEVSNLPGLVNGFKSLIYSAQHREIIMVDDFSTDGGAEFIASQNISGLKLIQLKNLITSPINSYKKKAIETGIAQSNSEWVITTDADCTLPPLWLSTINDFIAKHHSVFIAMPVLIKPEKTLVSIFQCLDFMVLQGITGASVGLGLHSMCNGANMAYTREAFNQVNGFAGIDAIASGDDMLLMHKIARQYPQQLSYIKSQDVVVETSAMPDWKSFFNQRIRWASKADSYDDRRIFWVLMLVYTFNAFLLVLPFVALLAKAFFLFKFWIIFLLIKTMVELFFLFPVAKFFKQHRLLLWFPLLQPLHIIYTVAAGWLGKFGSYKWKGRNVK